MGRQFLKPLAFTLRLAVFTALVTPLFAGAGYRVLSDAVIPFTQQSTASPGPSRWLDSKSQNWNRPGMSIPTAPQRTGESGATCPTLIAKPQSDEELALDRAGWLLFSGRKPTPQGSVSVILAMLGFDGRCQPYEYQLFVFVDGEFAGTLSPDLMYPRLDGSAIEVSFNANQGPTVEFARYGPDDPLCCASRISTAEYKILHENGHAVVSLSTVTTRMTGNLWRLLRWLRLINETVKQTVKKTSPRAPSQ
jgi:hypothetical protein